MRQLRRLLFGRGSGRAQSLVEFAMVLPLLLVVGLIITEFGRALWMKNVLTQAAREGCRRAVVSTVEMDDKLNVAEQSCDQFLTAAGTAFNDAEVSAEFRTVSSTNDVIYVRVQRDFSFIPGKPVPTQPMARSGGEAPSVGVITIVGEAVMHLEGRNLTTEGGG